MGRRSRLGRAESGTSTFEIELLLEEKVVCNFQGLLPFAYTLLRGHVTTGFGTTDYSRYKPSITRKTIQKGSRYTLLILTLLEIVHKTCLVVCNYSKPIRAIPRSPSENTHNLDIYGNKTLCLSG